jgi:hypothetical protein
MKSTIIKIFCMANIICMPFSLIASQYNATELTTISWGDNTNQLKIDLPFHEDVYNTPLDSTDDWIEYNGPKQGFVDNFENIYVASHRYMQLKGFDRAGRQIFDYSEGGVGYNPELFATALRKIYVDSLCRIYVVDGMRYDYVAVVDTAGHLIEKLSPYGVGSGVVVYDIHFNSDDILTICCKGPTFHTYAQGVISSGGGRGWHARNGYYYNARLQDSTQIRFFRYQNPDIQGVGADLQEAYMPLSGPIPNYSEFLGVDDETSLYVYLAGPTPADGRVLIYDTSYNLKGDIDFPRKENKYDWYMAPFMRPSDGNIYEFRCLDDGLHVIRWSKQ